MSPRRRLPPAASGEAAATPTSPTSPPAEPAPAVPDAVIPAAPKRERQSTLLPNPATEAEILKSIRLGLPRARAAITGNISIRTFYDFLNESRDVDEKGQPRTRRAREAIRFKEEIARAEADAAKTMVAQLRKNGTNGDSRAIMFLLSRRFPDEWGEKMHIEIKVQNERRALLDVCKEELDDANYRKVLSALAARDVVNDGEDGSG